MHYLKVTITEAEINYDKNFATFTGPFRQVQMAFPIHCLKKDL